MLYFLLYNIICSVCILRVKTIKVTNGEVEGISYNENVVVGYLGIPYAQAPVGNLRLEEAKELKKEDDILKGNVWPKKCYNFRQSESLNNKSEDCLYLSLLLPKTNKELKQPKLMVLFTNTDFDEQILLGYVSNNIGFAVVHYRQGPLAFFANTNAGITDVQTAIRWLNKNREYFGYGELTLIAENDDASMVSYAIAQNENLSFGRAILLNGNTAVRRFQPKFRRVQPTLKLLKDLDCPKENIEEIKSCIKAVNIDKLYNTVTNLRYPEAYGAPFRPKKAVKDRIYPVLIGFQSSIVDGFDANERFDMNYSEMDFKKFMQKLFPVKSYKNAKLLQRLAVYHYVNTSTHQANPYFLWTTEKKILFDRDILMPTRNLIFSLKPETNPVYVMDYAVPNPISSCLMSYSSEIFRAFCSRVWNYFIRFAIYGEPAESKCDLEDPSWPRIKSTKRDYYLKVEKNGTVAWEFGFYQSGFTFWNDLVPEIEKLELKSNFGDDSKQKKRPQEEL